MLLCLTYSKSRLSGMMVFTDSVQNSLVGNLSYSSTLT